MAEASFTYGSNWDVEFFWHRMDWLVRFDIALLGLLLGYTVFVFIRVFLRWRALPLGQALNATIITELKCDVSTLKSISNTAPYLGLFGTCLAILSAFSGVGMERHAFIAWITSKIATALVPAAAGIIVSLPATFGYEFGRTWLDTLSVNFSGRNRLLTTGQFSQLPPFALIGAPALAILVMVCMTFSSFHIPKGLGLVIASERCGDGALSD